MTPVRSGRAHAPHGSGALVEQKRDRLRAVADLDTSRFAGREERVGEPGPTADGLDDEAAPEAELAADAVGLPAVEQHPADAQGLAHPGHGGPGAIDESVDEPGVGPTAGHADEVAPHCLHRVRAEVDLGELPLAQVGDQPGDVVDPGVRKAEGAAAEVGVAAALLPRRLLQHDRPGSRLPGREGRAERGVPRAHDDDIGIGPHALPLRMPPRSHRARPGEPPGIAWTWSQPRAGAVTPAPSRRARRPASLARVYRRAPPPSKAWSDRMRPVYDSRHHILCWREIRGTP